MANTANEQALDEGSKLPAGIGQVPKNMEAQLQTVDVLTEIPSVVPGKPGFEKGTTLAGTYVRTDRVYSNKFKAGKKDSDGRKYRDLHIFRDAANAMFGIWSVGVLGYTLSRINYGTFLAVTYDGIADAAIKEGDNAPHSFTIKGINVDQNMKPKNEGAVN